ncbi:MAG: hypothetical protein ABI579_00405 [Candidatus Sumerlaeota bacterium]
MKSIGCVLVYIDHNGQVQTADDHTIATLPSDAPSGRPEQMTAHTETDREARDKCDV